MPWKILPRGCSTHGLLPILYPFPFFHPPNSIQIFLWEAAVPSVEQPFSFGATACTSSCLSLAGNLIFHATGIGWGTPGGSQSVHSFYPCQGAVQSVWSSQLLSCTALSEWAGLLLRKWTGKLAGPFAGGSHLVLRAASLKTESIPRREESWEDGGKTEQERIWDQVQGLPYPGLPSFRIQCMPFVVCQFICSLISWLVGCWRRGMVGSIKLVFTFVQET